MARGGTSIKKITHFTAITPTMYLTHTLEILYPPVAGGEQLAELAIKYTIIGNFYKMLGFGPQAKN